MHLSHDAHEGATRSTGSRPRASSGGWRRWLRIAGVVVLIAVVAAGLIRAVGVQTFNVPSASMSPTLEPGDRIVALRAAALFDTVERGDVIVFDGRGAFVGSLPPDMFAQMGAWFGIGPRDVYYVKRVIGVGGDTVQCCEDDGRLRVNDQPVDEPYLKDRSRAASGMEFAVEVPADRLWMMGDNRYDSTDSRDLLGRPGGGMISEDRVIGAVTGVE